MTVSTTISQARFEGNGATTVFPLGFEIEAESHLEVTVLRANGIRSPQNLNAEYTVSDVGNEAGATITMAYAPASGEALEVSRRTPRTQPVTLLPSSGFSPAAVAAALDRMAMIVQEAGDVNDRSLRFRIGETTEDLPSVASRAGKVLGFDLEGAPIAVQALAEALVSEIWAPILLANTVSDARLGLLTLRYERNAQFGNANGIAGVGAANTGIFATSGSMTNLPSGESGVGGHLLNLTFNTDVDEGFQVYFSPTGKMYRRGYTGGAFSTWVQAGDDILATLTASNSASLNFSGFVPAGFIGYEFIFDKLIPATDNVFPQVRLGTAGVADSGAVYQWSNLIYASGAPSVTAGTGATMARLSSTGLGTDTAEYGISGRLRVLTDGAAKLLHFEGLGFNTSQAPFGITAHGVYERTAAVNFFSFYMSSGNIESGSIQVRGLRK